MCLLNYAEGSALDRKKRLGRCAIVYCANKSAKGRLICCKHARQSQKIKNPTRYYFDQLRGNAKRRGKTFTITIEYFRDFCAKTNYLDLKGRFGDCYQIDRIDPRKGYEPGNIQVLTNSANSRKRYIDEKITSGNYPSRDEMRIYKDVFKNDDNDNIKFAPRRRFDPNADIIGEAAPF